MKLLIIVFISILCGIGSLFIDKIPNNVAVNDNNVKVVIEGVRSENGKIVLAVFKDQEGFKTKKPIKRIELNKGVFDKNEIELSLDKGLSKPHFDKFKFDINDRTIEQIEIRLRYIN